VAKLIKAQARMTALRMSRINKGDETRYSEGKAIYDEAELTDRSMQSEMEAHIHNK